MTTIENVLYTGRVHTTGGRDGVAHSDDGRLDLRLSPPGSAQPGTNPEQLFAAGWSACFIGAMGLAAGRRRLALPAGTAVDAEVELGKAGDGFQLRGRIAVSLPGLDPALAQDLVEEAHAICPYSRATRGNIEVELTLASATASQST